MKTGGSVGERLRIARQRKTKSLKEIADAAGISAATLSRIETSKQALDLSLFLNLSQILEANPRDLLGEPEEGDGRDKLSQEFSDLDHADKLRFWAAMSEGARLRAKIAKRPTAEVKRIAVQVEELLACIDYIQSELEVIQKRLKK